MSMSTRREAVASRVSGAIPGYSMAAAPGRRAVAKSVRVRKKEREQAFYLIFEKCFSNESIDEILELAQECRDFETTEYIKSVFGGVYDNVNEIDEIVKIVRFPGWKDTVQGRNDVIKALKSVFIKKRLFDNELFEKAYGYVEQYY